MVAEAEFPVEPDTYPPECVCVQTLRAGRHYSAVREGDSLIVCDVLPRAVWKFMSSVLESSKATCWRLPTGRRLVLPLAGVHCWLWRYR